MNDHPWVDQFYKYCYDYTEASTEHIRDVGRFIYSVGVKEEPYRLLLVGPASRFRKSSLLRLASDILSRRNICVVEWPVDWKFTNVLIGHEFTQMVAAPGFRDVHSSAAILSATTSDGIISVGWKYPALLKLFVVSMVGKYERQRAYCTLDPRSAQRLSELVEGFFRAVLEYENSVSADAGQDSGEDSDRGNSLRIDPAQ